MMMDIESLLAFFLFSVFLQFGPVDASLDPNQIQRFESANYAATIQGQLINDDQCMIVLTGYKGKQKMGTLIVSGEKAKDGSWQFGEFKEASFEQWQPFTAQFSNKGLKAPMPTSIYALPWTSADSLTRVGSAPMDSNKQMTVRYSDGEGTIIAVLNAGKLVSVQVIISGSDGPAEGLIMRRL